MKIILFALITFITLATITISPPAQAWDNTGHMLIAQIAYQQLQPQVRVKANAILDVLNGYYPYNKGFVRAATWADDLRGDDVMAFNNWHFIPIPLDQNSLKHHRTKYPPAPQIVWAINQSLLVLQSPKANLLEKSLFLRFLLHFVGDAHQPLHCVERYSTDFPDGDHGGAKLVINTPYAQDLHSFWDQGLEFFRVDADHYPLKLAQIRQLATKIMTDYPPTYFANQVDDDNPNNWVHESFVIAKNFAYDLTPGTTPSASYQHQGQKIVAERIALAGYRLATIINKALKD